MIDKAHSVMVNLPSNFPLWIIMSLLPLNFTEVDTMGSASPVPSLDSTMPGKLVSLVTSLNNYHHNIDSKSITKNSEQRMLNTNQINGQA